jgi:CRP/FNR family transcriptional regulator
MLRQVEISRRLADLSGPVEKRIARLLLTLSERMGRREGETLVIPLALTRQEIADMTSTTTETAIRVMSRWAKDNVVATRPDGFTLLDLAALRRAADEPTG